ncbi:helix-turn-helix domain-containing protein [Pseudoruegeria sp. SK021]|uniref:helix-turn-helix domain-containing protein n=1 Tax=Pseudoruegeria sp. SK021 TaxID=1933035 RepID=UPI000A264359|nr:XRE family transcriptional regulator [Pseudoruegeria sp. SK021]OSP54129.1 XRE family transcriptional regulator [Pseudoruegeria sp. SK021]
MSATKTRSEPQLGPAIRKRRKQMQLTLKDLGKKSGVSVGYLSQVERDNATPSLGTLAQISDALDVGLEYFVVASKPSDGLTRAGHRPSFSVADSSLTYESLATNFPGSDLSSYILHVPAGYRSETVCHAGEELIYVLDGVIDQSLGDQTFRMTSGDCLHYSGQTPHSWRNPTDNPARLLWTGTLAVLSRTGALKHTETPHKQEATEVPDPISSAI